ncbi:MAG TPA: lysophospholipid acyltransferase family protein [Gaiellaceae bacterium]|nr:lysophospholipid acyltransferase family protein [Gaiellaceae bacterium]
MTPTDLAWAIGRIYIGWPVRLFTRARAIGLDNVPSTGGVVYAINHLHWIDIPLIGLLSPRTVFFVAKAEAANFPLLGAYLRLHGAIAIHRGESDREAVRRMRDEARAGHVVGLFVEGTRQKSGRPGAAQPGAAMVGLQEDVPIVPVAIYGTQFWKPGNFRRCTVSFGEPLRFDDLPKNGKGYREATAVIERRINELFDELERAER